MKKKYLLITAAVFIIILSCTKADTPGGGIAAPGAFIPELPNLNCDSAILADIDTGKILFEKDSDIVIPPASMTKLVVNYVVFKELEKGVISLDDPVPVDRESDFRNQPPRSSLMFLEEGQMVTLRECLAGLAVPSGNDAAVAVAKYISGDVESFIGRMNMEMAELGLENTRFVDTSGYSEKNMTTASEFLKFCIKYIELYPGAAADFHSLESFTYPKDRNILPGTVSARGRIVQYNHNSLIGRVDGVDGLKTGYIDESGFNVALAAERNGMRLAGVIMGTRADTPKEARIKGGFDAVSLLSYGFNSFKTLEIKPEIKPEEIRIWMGREKYVPVRLPENIRITVPYADLDSLVYVYEFITPLKAPLEKGSLTGYLKISSKRGEVGSFPVVTDRFIERGSRAGIIADNIQLFFRYRLFSR